MSSVLNDISGKLRTYLLGKESLTDEVGTRIFAGPFPSIKTAKIDNQSNPKVSFRQTGGNPKVENFRYAFTVRADTLLEARQISVIISNLFTQEAFGIEDDDGNNLSYWAGIEGSLNDTVDEITGNPEVFFNVNFTSIY